MDRVLGMIGMAKRAGKLSAGAELAENDIRRGKSKLIIIAGDISQNGRKAITDACRYRRVEYIECADKAELGKYTGTEARTVISVNDTGFAKAILKKYDEARTGRND